MQRQCESLTMAQETLRYPDVAFVIAPPESSDVMQVSMRSRPVDTLE